MSIDLWPVGEDFAAEIGDVNLSLPISKNLAEEILTAYNTYAVLIFPNQRLTQDAHVRFAKIFGDIDHSMVADMEMAVPRVPTEIADVSNLGSDGSVLDEDHRMIGFQRGNRLWHTDSSFKHVPANASCLYMQSIPPVGGQTEFADMRAAWDALAPRLREKIRGRIALHSIANSRKRMGFDMTDEENASYPQVPQALVRSHATSGRTSIYLAAHARSIVGMPQEQADALIDTLFEHATQRRFIYAHRWRTNDLVVWDNRCVMHRGRPFDDTRWPRDAQRATTIDIGNTCEQEGLSNGTTHLFDAAE
ncbi:MAG: TauD/TfdA family dioxygenase [Pseudomonadota bacterium]|nr:TauD/TfdA family dioxygenase [Pseudomonadota bacterium]